MVKRSPFRLKREHLTRLLNPKGPAAAPCVVELMKFSSCIARMKGNEAMGCVKERRSLQDCVRRAPKGGGGRGYRTSLLRVLSEELRHLRF